MKAIVKTVDGNEFTITGDLATNIYTYLTQNKGASLSLPLLWVGDGEAFLNFANAVNVKFIETEESK